MPNSAFDDANSAFDVCQHVTSFEIMRHIFIATSLR